MEQTSQHRDTEAQRTDKNGASLCASVPLWLMQSIFSHPLTRWGLLHNRVLTDS